MSYAEYKHFFIKDDNGDIKFENKQMYDIAISNVKHKGYMLIRSESKEVSHKKYKFYFGIIIGKYCMSSNIFSGYTKKDIHRLLFEDLRGKPVRIKGNKRLVIDKPFEKYNENDMNRYVNELVPHLAVEYNIHVKTKPDQYEHKS